MTAFSVFAALGLAGAALQSNPDKTYDVDSSDEVKPKVHITDDKRPLPLNPRMFKGHTTIMNPGQTYMSSKSIAETLQRTGEGQGESEGEGGSRQLRQSDQATTDIPFEAGNLNSILNGAINERPNPLLENQVFSADNPKGGPSPMTRELSMGFTPQPPLPHSINLTPRVIYHGKKRRRTRARVARRLQPVGQLSFPYEGVAPRPHFASPPNVLILNKKSEAVPELNKSLLDISENRNSFYLNPIQDAIYDGEGAEKLSRYTTLRDTENDILGSITRIKDMADDLQIAMDHDMASFEDRLQRATQLVDGVNIV